jgi:hypothetical protein
VRYRFDGEICGFGTAAGHRVVIGRWPRSPFGPIADVMIELVDGHRLLLAPSADAASFVAATYTFDDVEVVDVDAERRPGRLTVQAGRLRAEVTIGDRDLIGWALRAVPRVVARSPRWAGAVDPIARRLLGGVRTRGSAGGGRREWYAAYDLHRLAGVTGEWDGTDLGHMTDVRPAVRFGFGSTPARPSIVALRTTIDVP